MKHALQMDQRGKVINGKVEECNQELAKIKKEMATAKGTRLKTLKQKALQVLRRRKMYDTQQSHLMNQQFNVDQVAFANESMQDTINTVSKCTSFNFSSSSGCCPQRSQHSIEGDHEELQYGLDGRSF